MGVRMVRALLFEVYIGAPNLFNSLVRKASWRDHLFLGLQVNEYMKPAWDPKVYHQDLLGAFGSPGSRFKLGGRKTVDLLWCRFGGSFFRPNPGAPPRPCPQL